MNEYTYKIQQLKIMLECEQGKYGKEGQGYGAHLSHWYGNSKAIQLDAGALEVLIKYYDELQCKCKYMDIKQECIECGYRFVIRVYSNGNYEYLTKTCNCNSEFIPFDHCFSISGAVKALNANPAE